MHIHKDKNSEFLYQDVLRKREDDHLIKKEIRILLPPYDFFNPRI